MTYNVSSPAPTTARRLQQSCFRILEEFGITSRSGGAHRHPQNAADEDVIGEVMAQLRL
jgi:hypothetical protein